MLDALAPVGSAGPLNGGLDAVRPPSAGAVQGADFSQMLAQVAADAAGSIKAGEAAAISGIQGKASVQQVVDAVLSAERTLQTTLAVRDKMVAAYQEISRIAI
jgi:flagellar hook-basal body complex protein FliE